ncbi:MAG: transposase [Deltaproteobacteria bacterium]|nr:transposase [Deltaproteobacteria bacterium]
MSWYVNCSATNGSIEAEFDAAICNKCPFCSGCPVVTSGEQARLNCTPKKLRLSERKALKKTEGFKNIYLMRSGIEGRQQLFGSNDQDKTLAISWL